nr:hypothetical protein GCM10020093_100380 [Planobispora longispora]
MRGDPVAGRDPRDPAQSGTDGALGHAEPGVAGQLPQDHGRPGLHQVQQPGRERPPDPAPDDPGDVEEQSPAADGEDRRSLAGVGHRDAVHPGGDRRDQPEDPWPIGVKGW